MYNMIDILQDLQTFFINYFDKAPLNPDFFWSQARILESFMLTRNIAHLNANAHDALILFIEQNELYQ